MLARDPDCEDQLRAEPVTPPSTASACPLRGGDCPQGSGTPLWHALDASGCPFACDYETRVLPSRKGSVNLDLMCDDPTKFTHYVCPSRILDPAL